jgi:DnaJ-domain-containing protein 1
MDRTGQRWGTKEQGMLIKFFQNGNDIEDISKVLGRPKDAIVHRLIELGVLGFDEASEPQRSGAPWSRREIDDLAREYRSQMQIDEIASRHKRYKNAILHKLVELRLLDVSDRNTLLNLSQSAGPEYVSHEGGEQNHGSADLNPYAVLGLKKGATNKEVRERYVYLIKAYHPDMALSKEAKAAFEEKIKEINDAYAKIKKEKGM